jgi:hypothetical protein
MLAFDAVGDSFVKRWIWKFFKNAARCGMALRAAAVGRTRAKRGEGAEW